jgi:hypothetical protein
MQLAIRYPVNRIIDIPGSGNNPVPLTKWRGSYQISSQFETATFVAAEKALSP